MSTLELIARWGTATGSSSRAETVTADSRPALEAHATRLLAEIGEPRAFVTHSVTAGRAFPGYRSCPREFYGPGLT